MNEEVSRRTNRAKNKTIIKRFILMFLPTVILTGIMLNIYVDSKNEIQIAVLNTTKQNESQWLAETLENSLTEAISDIEIIKNSSEVKDYMKEVNEYTEKEMIRITRNFILQRNVYDKIRVLDNEGMELIRLEYMAESFSSSDIDFKRIEPSVFVVPKGLLQDKSSRYYYQESKNLKSDQMFISRLDLNVENGYITGIGKPIIRIVVPIVGEGKDNKFLVLSVLAQSVLDKIKRFEQLNDEYSIHLVDHKGYYLHCNHNFEFGFMYDGMEDSNLEYVQPELWKYVTSRYSGNAAEYDGKLSYHQVVEPLKNIESTNNVINSDYSLKNWYLITSNNRNDFTMFSREMRVPLCAAVGIMIFIGTVEILFVVSMHNKESDRAKTELSYSVLASINSAVMILDNDKNVSFVNKTFLDLFRYSSKDILNKNIKDISVIAENDEFISNIWKSVDEESKWSGEVVGKTLDHKNIPLEISLEKIRDTRKDEYNYYCLFGDITEARKKEENIKKLINYDSLTGLPNLHLITNIMRKTLTCKDGESNASVISVHIRNYKIIKNNEGFKSANEAIRKLVKKIEGLIGIYESTLARTYEDEFLILISKSKGPKEIYKIAEKILKELEIPIAVGRKEMFIGCSIGIEMQSENIHSAGKFIENAQIAKEKARQPKEAHIQFYCEEMKEELKEKSELVKELGKALSIGEFSLRYQPQVNIQTNKVVGMEALIRWNNELKGEVSPAKFIPIAEEIGIIVEISNWVIEQACIDMRKVMNRGYDDLVCAINVSPEQFAHSDLYSIIKDALHRNNLKGSSLEIEITEGLLIENFELISKTLEKIRRLGVKVAIDDFGTGYSSLGYLNKLNIDKLKIDREFIKNYPNHDNGKIAKVIVALAHEMDLVALTEGAETEEQVEYLTNIGCDEIQGYFFSKPILRQELEEFLKDFGKEI